MTASNLVSELDADPEFQLDQRVRESVQRSQAEKYRVAERPVLEDLRAAGVDIETIDDLPRDKMAYEIAGPILLEWLGRDLAEDVKESIARALSVPWMRPEAAPVLVREFREGPGDPKSSLRWAIGNALSVVADDSTFDDLVAIARDAKFGTARQMVAVALGETSRPDADLVLRGLLADEDVQGHAAAALAKVGTPASLPALELLLGSPRRWIREKARNAISSINGQPA